MLPNSGRLRAWASDHASQCSHVPGPATGTGRQSSGGAADGGDPADGSGNPLLERFDPDDGLRLLALPGELAWAGTWMVDANEVVTPRLGLAAPPIID